MTFSPDCHFLRGENKNNYRSENILIISLREQNYEQKSPDYRQSQKLEEKNRRNNPTLDKKTDNCNDVFHDINWEFYRDQRAGEKGCEQILELSQKADYLERVELELCLWFRWNEQIHTGFLSWITCSTSVGKKLSYRFFAKSHVIIKQFLKTVHYLARKDRSTLGTPKQFQVSRYLGGIKKEQGNVKCPHSVPPPPSS